MHVCMYYKKIKIETRCDYVRNNGIFDPKRKSLLLPCISFMVQYKNRTLEAGCVTKCNNTRTYVHFTSVKIICYIYSLLRINSFIREGDTF